MHTFYLQHGYGSQGPFCTEGVRARESWRPQPRRGTVTACRFVLLYCGRWHRLFSDRAARGLPHFIRTRDGRIAVSGVCP